jgi:hypothetical protein
MGGLPLYSALKPVCTFKSERRLSALTTLPMQKVSRGKRIVPSNSGGAAAKVPFT